MKFSKLLNPLFVVSSAIARELPHSFLTSLYPDPHWPHRPRCSAETGLQTSSSGSTKSTQVVSSTSSSPLYASSSSSSSSLSALPSASTSKSSSSLSSTTTNDPSKTSMQSTTTTTLLYASSIPNIDVCGLPSSSSNTTSVNGISCPGAGTNGYYYRCCSQFGHCGPKNPLEPQSLYCGTGCQPGYGSCVTMGATSLQPPPNPTGTPGIAPEGDTCGPIVNKRCADGLCCSGSNYCGTGEDFCGSANWCQGLWGECDAS